MRAEQIVTLPRILGPGIPGIADAPCGFVPIDTHCRVLDTGGSVFAAGDSCDFPIKHGGIAAQQADTAADGIAHRAGAAEAPPPPFEPVIRGMLLTGRNPLYLAAHIVEGRGWHSEIYEQPPWPADEKVIAAELGPYLRSREAAVPRP